MKKILILAALALLGFTACSNDDSLKSSPAPQPEQTAAPENLTTVVSTLTFKTTNGLVALTSPDNFTTAKLTAPNGVNEELSEPVPGDGNPIPANGMLLLNKNGYSIHVASDSSAILKTPNGEFKLENGELTKS